MNGRATYYVKNTESGTWLDITTQFNGVRVLSVTGMDQKGKPINIYTAQWVNSQTEDFMITTLDTNNNPVVIRENVDIEVTFIVRQKYVVPVSGSTPTINVQTVHNNFVNYMTNTDVWLKSVYLGNKYAHCVCLKEYKPTATKLQRGTNSYMMGTITLHCISAPTA